MTDENNNADRLLNRLNMLSAKQDKISMEIKSLRKEIFALQQSQPAAASENAEQKPDISSNTVRETVATVKTADPQLLSTPAAFRQSSVKSGIENFIGENIISKIGITVTVIGVAIGTKYAIEHQLVSPPLRIILGYLFAVLLLAVAIRLKAKYNSFSAVLVSGATSVMYLVTYAACNFYELIPRIPAFAMMVIFTVFTALAAIVYNRSIIAHLGLVGAYAIPFLLSDGSGQFAVLMSYMVVINAGILAVSIKKYWKSLYYTSFAFTWLIFAVWYLFDYETLFFVKTFVFATLFFIMFYVTFLAYKLIRGGKYNAGDIVLLLANSFIFYGFGFAMVNSITSGGQHLGLFTLFNAAIHFAVAIIIHRRKLVDRNLFYLITGITLIFITIAIPVQLNGNWVTLLWTGEAALLFWTGRTKTGRIYETLSFPVMIMAFLSMIHDWNHHWSYHGLHPAAPFLNIIFFTAILFVAASGLMVYIDQKTNAVQRNIRSTVITYYLSAVFIIALYCTFYVEIAHYFNLQNLHSGENPLQVSSLCHSVAIHLKSVWLINYTMLFVSLLSLTNQKLLHKNKLGYFNFGIIIIVVLIYLTKGLHHLSELRENSMLCETKEYSYLNVRYVSLALAVILMIVLERYVADKRFNMHRLKIPVELFLNLISVWIMSSELLFLMDMTEGTNSSHKLGLTVLWGVYAVLMTIRGIWEKKKHLRYGAMALFGVTLVKLFFYDITHLNTLSKTIAFVLLGLLMLLISFLYNKYKDKI